MNLKKIFLYAASLLLVVGCSSESSDPVTPPNPNNGDTPVPTPTPTPTPSPSNLPMPSSVSNPTVLQNLYATWKAGHFTTLQEESAKYPSLASNFSEIFGPYIQQGLPVARVIWSTYNWDGCLIEEANGTNMYKRGCTVSEGIGYGMLITVFQEDWDAYNGLWNYSKAYRNSVYAGGNGLMPWLTSSFSWDIGDKASATDADLDIATSLIIAYYKTGNQDYLNDAIALAGNIWNNEINPTNNLIYSGDTPMWKTAADPAYNPSYFSPVALRLFAAVDQAHDWNAVLEAEYAYMLALQAGGTGVFPDWSNAAGQAINPKNNSADKTYWTFNKESVRIPWRIAWDYYWYQDPRAGQILNTLQQFIATRSNNDPAQIPSTSYSWNTAVGADIPGQTLSVQWLGAWCLTGMAGATAWLDGCLTLFNQKEMQISASSYFPNILQMMFGQLMNGQYTKNF